MKLSKFVTNTAVVLGLAAATAGAASADSHGGNIKILHRVTVMKIIGGDIGAIAKVAKGEAAYSPALIERAKRMAALSQTVTVLFPDDSKGRRAKPEIWTDRATFEKAAGAFGMAMPGLVKAVETGDRGQIGQALGQVGKSCGGCHKPFRKPKE